MLATLPASAQRSVIYRQSIKTLQTVAGTHWTALPIIELGGDQVIDIDFDDLTHEAHRYAYRIEHCDAGWTPTEGLFDSDYIDGFAEGNLIDDSHESVNTNTLYTHYHLSIPNDRCRPRLSGNYRITIYDENEDDAPVLQTCFMVTEQCASIALQVTGNTDRGVRSRYQQIEMSLDYAGLKVTDWSREVKTVVLQNNLWHTAVVNPTPQYIRPDGLAWTHCPQLVFDGGNEFRKFEILDVNHANMGVERTEWDGHEYHAHLWPDEPRPNYVYDEDANGAYFIRNSDNREIAYTSEYQLVHFYLKAPHTALDYYLNAAWTYDSIAPDYQLTWNPESGCYEATVLLKQGYYNYQYLAQQPTGQLTFAPTEGSYYQTENQYTALVYLHTLGSRYDRLIATATLHTATR